MTFNMSTNLAGAEPEQTYYIAVCAVNGVGKGLASTSIVTGELEVSLLRFVIVITLAVQFHPVLQLKHLTGLRLTLKPLYSISILLNQTKVFVFSD